MELTLALKLTDETLLRQLHSLLILGDKEFIPPLSQRSSTTQSNLQGDASKADILPYFEKMLEQSILAMFVDDKLFGFEIGADDYVVKPFSPKEIMARINAVLKRNTPATTTKVANPSIKFDGLEIDMLGRNVYVDGKKAELTPKEYELLFYMVNNKGIALSREKLISDVWGYDFYGDVRTLDTHIKLLRKSLGRYASYIVTLRGVGYRFEG